MALENLGMIIAAGGSGSRFSRTENKLLADFRNKPLIVHCLSTFLPVLKPGNLVIAAPAAELENMKCIVERFLPGNSIRWTIGGATRLASVSNALKLLPLDLELVAIHDAARPLATAQLLTDLCCEALSVGGAIPGVPPVDTVKAVDENGIITQNLIRSELALVATPQVFRAAEYRQAFELLPQELLDGTLESLRLTDDAAVFCNAGFRVRVLPGCESNPKITHPGDIGKIL